MIPQILKRAYRATRTFASAAARLVKYRGSVSAEVFVSTPTYAASLKRTSARKRIGKKFVQTTLRDARIYGKHSD